MKSALLIPACVVLIVLVGILGLNASALGEKVWDEDSQTYIEARHYDYVPPAYIPPQTDQVELLWDDIHDSDGDDLYVNYSQCATLMTSLGINATQIQTGSLNAATLAGYDILVVIDEEIAYSNTEITDIQNWVAGGGKLLVIGENSGAFNMASHNVLLTPYNMQFVAVSSSNANIFTPHPITTGVNSLSWLAGSAQSFSAPAIGIGWNASMQYTLTVNEAGITVVIINDSGMMNNSSIGNVDNYLCMENTFNYLAAGYTPFNLSIILTPIGAPIQIPSTGGSFFYDLEIANNDTVGGIFDVWIDVVLPNGNVHGPLILRTGILIGPGAVITRSDMEQYIPDRAPAGNYSYRGQVGEHPNDVWDMSSFGFEKLTLDGGGELISGWYLHGWGESSLAHGAEAVASSARLKVVGANPFNPETTLRFHLSSDGEASLKVYNIAGHEVVNLMEGYTPAGEYDLTFNGSGLSSGIYFARLQAESEVRTVKLLLTK